MAATRSRTGLLLAAAALFAGSLTGCANIDYAREFRVWGKRGVGGVLAYGLHEACHVAVGAALGAKIGARMGSSGPTLLFSDLSAAEHRGVAIAGNACTALAAEVVVDTGLHQRSEVAWGMAAYHSVNSFAYAFVGHGDAEHWQEAGGGRATWRALNASHASRIGAQLAWDAGAGDWLRQRWAPGSPTILPGYGSGYGPGHGPGNGPRTGQDYGQGDEPGSAGIPLPDVSLTAEPETNPGSEAAQRAELAARFIPAAARDPGADRTRPPSSRLPRSRTRD